MFVALVLSPSGKIMLPIRSQVLNRDRGDTPDTLETGDIESTLKKTVRAYHALRVHNRATWNRVTVKCVILSALVCVVYAAQTACPSITRAQYVIAPRSSLVVEKGRVLFVLISGPEGSLPLLEVCNREHRYSTV